MKTMSKLVLLFIAIVLTFGTLASSPSKAYAKTLSVASTVTCNGSYRIDYYTWGHKDYWDSCTADKIYNYTRLASSQIDKLPEPYKTITKIVIRFATSALANAKKSGRGVVVTYLWFPSIITKIESQ